MVYGTTVSLSSLTERGHSMNWDNLFQSLAPANMMKPTTLLIIDHDIPRYHSFDMLRWTLYRDSVDKSRFEHFTSLKPAYRPLLDIKFPLDRQVKFMQTHFLEFNPFEAFTKDQPGMTDGEYNEELLRLVSNPEVKITPTDVASRFDIVFQRKDISGILLQHKGDLHHPSFYSNVLVYESSRLLDMLLATEIMIKHQVNAVMISSIPKLLLLINNLIERNYTSPTTFIVARYAYNFVPNEKGEMSYPMYYEVLDELALRYTHEFGYFNPYSGLTYKYKLEETTNGREH